MTMDKIFGDCITLSDQKTTANAETFCGMLLVVELAISHLLDALVQKGVVAVEEEADWISATRARLRATREKRSIDGQIGVETLLDCLEASVLVSNPLRLCKVLPRTCCKVAFR
jgi:hypothetical protein